MSQPDPTRNNPATDEEHDPKAPEKSLTEAPSGDALVEEFPPRQLREAGLTRGGTPHPPKDFDLSPEELLEDETDEPLGKPGPRGTLSRDFDLSVTDEDEEEPREQEQPRYARRAR
ncbi:hypothetical protein TUM18999_51910 [Pseudomonas tohonis]|uniref:Phosphotransferase system, HPr-related protein n=1 Tax=Pseudomonas tohonis TaxID=2725477 RepID=A0A6J4EBI7_9PSED|nr:hypothetical protein [Pseudomonas tohonis]UXY52192.1 hypothetical protein N9L84_25055 [Pseudomonas tohonis]BCG27000.1 hypothetical protein TUM18999_51910 [Pseudomonas tohonis]GJN50264.1 hypothetical protein TUM20286_00160 [Pseudomonas tohonis]